MSATGTKKILVTGGTGRQGGAAATNLASLGHNVRIMTRHPEKAKELQGPNVEVVQGDFRKAQSLLSALEGVDGVFLMGTPYEEGPEAETAQGKAMIDACVKKDIGHVMYSSVCCANKRTGVPHFDSKHEVEEHLRGAGLSYTILRPVWFMENFASEWYRPSIEKGVLSSPLRADRPLQMVSVVDIGRIVAHEEKQQRQQQNRKNNQSRRTDAPAGSGDHPHKEWQEDQLPGRTRAAENAESQAAASDKPTVADRGCQHRTDTAGAEADDDAPDQEELPELIHHHRTTDTGHQQRQTAEHDFARSKAVDQITANRPGDAEEQ